MIAMVAVLVALLMHDLLLGVLATAIETHRRKQALEARLSQASKNFNEQMSDAFNDSDPALD